MIELSPELIRKHLQVLREAKTNVKGHTRRSKTGKVYSVQSYDREVVAKLEAEITQLKSDWKAAKGDSDKRWAISKQIGIRQRKINLLKSGGKIPDRSGPRMKKGETEDSYIQRRFDAGKNAKRVLG